MTNIENKIYLSHEKLQMDRNMTILVQITFAKPLFCRMKTYENALMELQFSFNGSQLLKQAHSKKRVNFFYENYSNLSKDELEELKNNLRQSILIQIAQYSEKIKINSIVF